MLLSARDGGAVGGGWLGMLCRAVRPCPWGGPVGRGVGRGETRVPRWGGRRVFGVVSFSGKRSPAKCLTCVGLVGVLWSDGGTFPFWVVMSKQGSTQCAMRCVGCAWARLIWISGDPRLDRGLDLHGTRPSKLVEYRAAPT